jgi:hypothetical protein
LKFVANFQGFSDGFQTLYRDLIGFSHINNEKKQQKFKKKLMLKSFDRNLDLILGGLPYAHNILQKKFQVLNLHDTKLSKKRKKSKFWADLTIKVIDL